MGFGPGVLKSDTVAAERKSEGLSLPSCDCRIWREGGGFGFRGLGEGLPMKQSTALKKRIGEVKVFVIHFD